MNLWQKVRTFFSTSKSIPVTTPPHSAVHRHKHRWFPLVLVLVSGVLMYRVLLPYLSLIVITLILALLFDPVYQRLNRLLRGRRGIASFLTTIIVFLSIIIPALVVTTIAAQQALSVASRLAQNIDFSSLSIKMITERMHEEIARLPGGDTIERALASSTFDLPSTLADFGKNAGAYVSSQFISVLKNGTVLLTNSVLFFFILMYWFQDKERFFARMIELSPLEDEDDRMLVKRFRMMAGQLIKGNFLIAFLQGALGGIIFAVLGIPSAVFWGVMMGFASFIPLGSSIIWIPAAIFLFASGAVGEGIILLLFGNFVIGLVDNLVRAKLLESGEISLPPALTLLSVIGGIQLFGFLGFLYGPLIAVMFLASLRLYQENRKG